MHFSYLHFIFYIYIYQDSINRVTGTWWQSVSHLCDHQTQTDLHFNIYICEYVFTFLICILLYFIIHTYEKRNLQAHIQIPIKHTYTLFNTEVLKIYKHTCTIHMQAIYHTYTIWIYKYTHSTADETSSIPYQQPYQILHL